MLVKMKMSGGGLSEVVASSTVLWLQLKQMNWSKVLAQMVKVILKLGVWLKDKTVEDKKVLREAGGWAERPPEDLGVPQLL